MENNSVNVYLRVRASQIWEASSPAKSYINYQESTEKMLILETNPHVFDHIFYSTSTQDEVFQKIVSLTNQISRNFNIQ
jgi:hypothetical protein